MRLIKPSIEVLKIDDIKLIEIAGRTCYKSEDKITEDSAKKFVKMLVERGHEAMIEHSNASVKVVCDRGVTHEIVRHRLFSFAQESTRYCNYSKDKFNNQITCIIPPWVNLPEGDYYDEDGAHLSNDVSHTDFAFVVDLIGAEITYKNLLAENWTPQQARAVLPNALKTEIVISGNFREWRHFFKLRCSEAAHPQAREVANMILAEFERLQPDMIWR